MGIIKSNIHNISKSALFEFLSCPRSYKEHRIIRTKPSNEINISGLIRGICVHEIEEKISKGEEYNIDAIFLDIISGQINRGVIKPSNWDWINNHYDEYMIYDDEETRYNKVQIKDMEIYNELRFKFKPEIDEAYSIIPAFEEALKTAFEFINKFQVDVEIRQDLQIPLNQDNIIHVTSIFDKVLKMPINEIVTVIPGELDKDELVSSYEKLTKVELVDLCSQKGIIVEKGDLKIDLAKKFVEFSYEEILENAKEQAEIETKEQKDFLLSLGYNEKDLIDVVLDIKTGKKSKTKTEVEGMIDVYIYAALFYLMHERIPVFMIFNIAVLKTKTVIQKFNIFLTLDVLQDWIEYFMTQMESIFVHKRYPKKFIDNWKCHPERCEYFDICHKDKVKTFLKK